jgi:6-pyruvoyltetrahydropterin/6-carboxytetrahydropterin synthase
MDSSSALDTNRAQGLRPDAPLFITVTLPDAESAKILQTAAEASKCRVYSRVGGPPAWVVEGAPAALHELRNRILAVPAFDRLRETIEWTLSERAAPGGFYFDAAHNLPRYAGKCEHLHGHTFRLRVTLKAPLDTWSGMAFDFMEMKRIVDERIVKILDHAYINEIIANPSAEFISVWVWRKLGDLPLHEIKVWETPTSFVTYQGPPPV